MEKYPISEQPEVRRPRHRAEVVEVTEQLNASDSYAEHAPQHKAETLGPIVERSTESRIEEAREDLERLYGVDEGSALVEPVDINSPLDQASFDRQYSEPQLSRKKSFLNKLFPREVQGIKMTAMQSLLAGTVGRVAAYGAPDGIFGIPPDAEFANPITRRLLYKRAQNDENLANYVMKNDDGYGMRPKYSEGSKSLKTAMQAATVLPFVASELLLSPVLLTGIARKDSPNKFLRGIATFNEKFDRFSSKPFAKKPTVYNLDRYRYHAYRDPYDI